VCDGYLLRGWVQWILTFAVPTGGEEMAVAASPRVTVTVRDCWSAESQNYVPLLLLMMILMMMWIVISVFYSLYSNIRASAQHNVARGILFLPVRPCVHPETSLTWYLAEYLTHFRQTYTSDALWDRDERLTFSDQKVKGQGHIEIHYAGNSTFSFHNSSGRRRTILNDLASSYFDLVLLDVLVLVLLYRAYNCFVCLHCFDAVNRFFFF